MACASTHAAMATMVVMAVAVCDLERLVSQRGVLVLSGAGLSTESGIPDYRGPTGASRRHQPMSYQTFVRDPQARRSYWARSYLGWRQLASARPNRGHIAVARLQRAGVIDHVITQNVDGLHQAAGSSDVIELHGGLDRVVCLSCGHRISRVALDRRLRAANPGFDAVASQINPDGDVELSEDQAAGFVTVSCEACGSGPLKPDVVFFGERVPRERVDRCFAWLDVARTLLVLGSSLTVMSGYRFVLGAVKRGVPVAIVNEGPTRGDGDATLRVDAPLGRVLEGLADSVLADRA